MILFLEVAHVLHKFFFLTKIQIFNMSSMNLKLKKFDIKSIKFPLTKVHESSGPTLVCLGKRHTGKSIMCRDILYHHQSIPMATVISSTEEMNEFYGGFVPKLFIHFEYNTLIIENLLKRQRALIHQVKQETKDFGKSNIDGRTICILDDCLFDNSWASDKMMRFLFMNGRHVRVMLIICMQYPIGIPPNLRSNIDYTFILRDNNMGNRKKIYEHYAGIFPTFDSFCQIMDQCTENYECLVIDNTSTSNKLEDNVFWYKANPHPDFKLGDKKYWDLSKNYNYETGRPFEANQMKKKNYSAIEVKKI